MLFSACHALNRNRENWNQNSFKKKIYITQSNRLFKWHQNQGKRPTDTIYEFYTVLGHLQ